METAIPKELIDCALNDIYKNLFMIGAHCRPCDVEDFRQEITLTYLEIIQKKSDFTPGYLYWCAFGRCLRQIHNIYAGISMRVDYYDPAFMPTPDLLPPEIVYDEKMETENTDKYLGMLQQAGIEIDDPQGIVFALWFLGMSLPEIVIALKAAGIKPAGINRVSEDMHQAFRDIRMRTGLHHRVVRLLRDKYIKTLRQTRS